MTADFLSEATETRSGTIFQVLSKKNYQPRILYPTPQNTAFRNEDKANIREFVTSGFTLKEWLKKFSKQKGNNKRRSLRKEKHSKNMDKYDRLSFFSVV